MNTTLKQKYIKYLSDEEKQGYLQSLKQLKIWRETDCDTCQDSAGVKSKRNLKMIQRKLAKICDTPQKIKINNLLPELMCHINSKFIEHIKGYKQVVGYNITACRCGNYNSLECHTCNITDDGKLVDFTTDFDKQTYKWFLPLKSKNISGTILQRLGLGLLYTGKYRCRCNPSKAKKLEPETFTGIIQSWD